MWKCCFGFIFKPGFKKRQWQCHFKSNSGLLGTIFYKTTMMISIGEHGRVSLGRKADIQWKQETCFHCYMYSSFVTRFLQAKWHGRDLHTKTIRTQLCSDGVSKTRVLHEIYIYPKFLVVGSPASWSHPSSTPLMSLSFSLWKSRHWKLLIFGSSIEWQSCLNHHQFGSLLELQVDGHTAAAYSHQFHRQYISHFQELPRWSCLTKARKMFRLLYHAILQLLLLG
jgi:hypothetical protein